MLSQEVFKQGLKELEEVFEGFTITESKMKTWYKYSKKLENSMWQKKIANCIKGCSKKIPTLADILDIKGYYNDDSGNRPYNKFCELEEVTSGKMPAGFKEHMDKVIKKMRMPAR